MTPSAPDCGTTTSAVTACDLFLVFTIELSVSRPMPPNRICRVALDQLRPAGDLGIGALGKAVVQGQHVVLDRLDQPQPLQFVQLLRILLRQILRLGPVGGGVVQLPDVVVEGRQLDVPGQPRRAVPGDGRPALVVDAAVACHLEVLCLAPLGRFGIVERVRHADAFDRAAAGPR